MYINHISSYGGFQTCPKHPSSRPMSPACRPLALAHKPLSLAHRPLSYASRLLSTDPCTKAPVPWPLPSSPLSPTPGMLSGICTLSRPSGPYFSRPWPLSPYSIVIAPSPAPCPFLPGPIPPSPFALPLMTSYRHPTHDPCFSLPVLTPHFQIHESCPKSHMT